MKLLVQPDRRRPSAQQARADATARSSGPGEPYLLQTSSRRDTALRVVGSATVATLMLLADIGTGAKGMAGVLYVPLLVAVATKARTREVLGFGLLGMLFSVVAYLVAKHRAPDLVTAWPLAVGFTAVTVTSALLARLVASREALIGTNCDLAYSEWRYRSIFEQTNFPFWERDFSGAYAIYEELKAQGVTNLVEHSRREPGLAARLAKSVRVIAFNDALMRLVDATSRDEFPLTLADMMPDADTMLTLQQALFNGGTRLDGRSTLTTIKGETKDVWVSAELSPDPGRPGVMVGMLVDLTESERARRALSAAQAELSRASRVATIGALSISIAHELNQPLAAAVMNAQTGLRYLSRMPPDTQAASAAVARAVQEGNRAADIVRRTRDLATSRASSEDEIDAAQLVREVVALLGHEIGEAAVRVDLALPAKRLMLLGDRVVFQQMLINLVANAVQAMVASPLNRRILTIEVGRDGDDAVIAVRDTGPGIPEEHLGKLFDPFFTTKQDGVGIGLAVSRSAAEAMGGRLLARNASVGGAIFECFIPIGAEG